MSSRYTGIGLICHLYQKRFMCVDFVICLLCVVVFIVWCERFNGNGYVNEILCGNRSAIYGALTSVFGSMLGFIIAAAAIVMSGAQSPKLTILRESRHYPTLGQVYASAVTALGLSLCVCIFALIFDKDSRPCIYITYFAFFFSLLSGFRIYECIFVLKKIMAVVFQRQNNRQNNN